MRSNMGLMKIQVEVLFTQDENGCLQHGTLHIAIRPSCSATVGLFVDLTSALHYDKL